MDAIFKASANPYKSVIMELEKACPMIEQRMLNPTTNQHQSYFIHRAWNQSDLQAMKMQMKDYDDNPEGFVEQIFYYISSNKANHDHVIGLMTTVLPVKIWQKTKELARWPDASPEGENEIDYNARVQQLLVHLRTAISPPEINWEKDTRMRKKKLKNRNSS